MDKIHSSWKPLFDKFTIDIDIDNADVFPPKEFILRVFEMDVSDIKIVLLGQDPYHGINQADGLSFSVPKDMKIPPSLKNIFKELSLDFPDRNYKFENGNLERWFNEEKIFLLNAALTVLKGKPNSHMDLWKEFTNNVIRFIDENNKNCVFLLLGNFAKSKSEFIENKSHIITCPHPSPLSRGFIGSNVFIKVEQVLGHSINWAN
jgi:uracil-DNA glycosylase